MPYNTAMSTRLAVSIMVESLTQALDQAKQGQALGANLVEYRMDRVPSLATAQKLVDQSPLPCIITCRPVWEGGFYDGPEDKRQALFISLLSSPASPTYIDLELKAWESSPTLRQALEPLLSPAAPSAKTTGLILSSHDFDTRSTHLHQRLEAMAQATACRVLKVAWRARSIRDNIEAFEIVHHRLKPSIALCMGQEGLASRILAKKFGAVLTFAALDAQHATAPGQPTLQEAKQLYRWDALKPTTRVYGVIGYPVGHSMSPAIHNAGFSAVGHDGVYLPMPIAPDYTAFKATLLEWLGCKPLDFYGASVTIPHKHNLLQFVQEQGGTIEPLAQTIGAANTLTRDEQGHLTASNTDYAGALDAICQTLHIERHGLAGKRVAVIGAGGVSRAIIAGLLHYGASVTLYNRTMEKAQALAEHFKAMDPAVLTDGASTSAPLITAIGFDALPHSQADIVINCTPLGMHPHEDQTPVPQFPQGWGAGTVVFDTIYNPLQTRLLAQAKAAGCLTINGADMFIRQAALQFTQWTHQPAPLDIFRHELLSRLGNR